jgi:hypothetical protein
MSKRRTEEVHQITHQPFWAGTICWHQIRCTGCRFRLTTDSLREATESKQTHLREVYGIYAPLTDAELDAGYAAGQNEETVADWIYQQRAGDGDVLTATISELRAAADKAAEQARYWRGHKPRQISRADVYTRTLISTFEEQRSLLGALALRLEQGGAARQTQETR